MPDYHAEGLLSQLQHDYKIGLDPTFEEELKKWNREHRASIYQELLRNGAATPAFNPFKPTFIPWWSFDVPATIRDDKVDIRITKPNITFNFND